MNKTRILLADDHYLVREGFRSLLEKISSVEVVAEINDGQKLWSCSKAIVVSMHASEEHIWRAARRRFRLLLGGLSTTLTPRQTAAPAAPSARRDTRQPIGDGTPATAKR